MAPAGDAQDDLFKSGHKYKTLTTKGNEGFVEVGKTELPFFSYTSGFRAGQFPEIIQLGAANLTAAFYINIADHG